MANVSIANTTANISGKTVVLTAVDATITGLLTFNRSPSAPFAVAASSAKVTNLDADLLDGQDGTYYTTASNLTGIIAAARLGLPELCDGRLTLTSGTPVTTADVTGATTIYFTPYKGDRIALYDGSSTWTVYSFTEKSLALGTLTSGLPYDVFIYDNSGTPTLESLAWTNGTTRATALTTQNGVLVKTGATTRRYLGTFYTTSTTQTEDSATKRYLWNYYNRVPRQLLKLYGDTNWTYTTATLRQANANAANQVEVVVGWVESVVRVSLHAQMLNNTGGMTIGVGIGYDSTSAGVSGGVVAHNCVANGNEETFVTITHYPAVGRHYYAGLEFSQVSGTTTWYGTTGAAGTFPAGVNSGLDGSIEG